VSERNWELGRLSGSAALAKNYTIRQQQKVFEEYCELPCISI
jgi:hypothetical protein